MRDLIGSNRRLCLETEAYPASTSQAAREDSLSPQQSDFRVEPRQGAKQLEHRPPNMTPIASRLRALERSLQRKSVALLAADARKAPELVELRFTSAWIEAFYDWDRAAAEEQFVEAIRLDPN